MENKELSRNSSEFYELPLNSSRSFTESFYKEKDDNLEHEATFYKQIEGNNLCKSTLTDIYDTVNKLEESLANSRQEECQYMMQMVCIKAENRALKEKLQQADKRNKNLTNLFQRNETTFLDISTKDKQSGAQKCLCSSSTSLNDRLMQTIKNVVRRRGRQLKMKNKEILYLKQNLEQISNKQTGYERKIKRLNAQYVTMKKVKELALEEMQNKVIQLQKKVDAVLEALNNISLQHNNLLRIQMLQAIDSKDALLLQTIKQNKRLYHENALLRCEVLLQSS